MDIVLHDGDLKLNGMGMPVTVSGEEELLGHIRTRLLVPRGSFVLDPELGSRLHLLGGECPGDPEPQALSYVQEALYGMPGVEVNAVSLCGVPPERIRVGLTLYGMEREVEAAL